MGNNNPPPRPQQPANSIMNSIYNTTGQIPYQNAHPRYSPPVASTERVGLKLDSYIDKSKLTLTRISPGDFQMSFPFTSSTLCQINIYYYHSEYIQGGSSFMAPQDPSGEYPPICLRYGPCKDQIFTTIINVRDFSRVFASSPIPVTIEIYSVMPNEQTGAITRTYCKFRREKHSIDIKIMKQIVIINGVTQTLMDVYGMRNTQEDNLCIICLCEPKDTLINPCRHMCLCSYCSEQLGHQLNKVCPVCRCSISNFVKITANLS